ncbi:hypothetical protein [Actinoplanes couchii]|uniref:hypothetical protein n=1 Tax=Actinoplanes couchii TaxID=403638 RepID=UPI0019435EBD|nr:hypothetical protein [Actinoplanes couchii]MDR6319945.1 hypothetical protein [Actinoplanes couchii]
MTFGAAVAFLIATVLAVPAGPASAGGLRPGVESAAAGEFDQATMDRVGAELAATAAHRSRVLGRVSVCYNAHLADIGWQGQRCDGRIAGTTGENRRMEAIMISLGDGTVCYNAHLADIGWQGQRCDNAVAGTTGQSRRMEAIKVVSAAADICYDAHVQNIGWQGRRCGGATAGTTGQSRQMEAIRITASPIR